MSASTETLLSDVQSALHRRGVRPHSPDRGRPGWRAQPTLLDDIPAVILTWHGVKAPSSYTAKPNSTCTAAGWLLHLERHLEHEFVVGRLYAERPYNRAGRTLVALVVLDAGNEQSGR
ncbi:hypothetical protein OG453_07745 [Streptomyces sp. NBC_01381]|uniref:hypothetical protein n=1 Tax=Streptomyces sp. NBC_01381 TaxID=2903845 RepID=UPI0022551EB3|nr:hypothetical protein [Streptomyces sp. NBC_01381]MCX4666563.1 hypothetical protein [Streptomyces sp. NBC_01381]